MRFLIVDDSPHHHHPWSKLGCETFRSRDPAALSRPATAVS
jgi:hypothetical protein